MMLCDLEFFNFNKCHMQMYMMTHHHICLYSALGNKPAVA